MKKKYTAGLVFVVFALVGALFASAVGAQILGKTALNVERRGHTATEIAGGKVLVVGGENGNGVVGQAEVFDLASRIFLVIGASTARTDHTATLLPDGRVLIAGGRDSVSALDSTEIFNPADNSFSAGPQMKRARAGHTATILADGRILFVGGDNVGSTEIYDPNAQLFTNGPFMAEPRTLHGAALLHNGKVLIAGGTDPNDGTVLDSAELFDPQNNNFMATGTTMNIARGLPTLKVLPDGKVQVIGGDTEFSMEMFDGDREVFGALAHLPPTVDLVAATLSAQTRAAIISTTINTNPLMQNALANPDISELVGRADHTTTELQGQALVAGGVDSQGQVLSSSIIVESSQATVTTDKLDYPPLNTVTITGAGWQPNETVAIVVHEEPETHADVGLSSVADNQGKFTNTDFAPATSDFGRSFTLTALGQSSGRTAQTAFSDAISTDYKHWAQIPPAAGSYINGAVQSSNSSYFEGETVPHVYRVTGLTVNTVYGFQIFYDYFKNNTCGLQRLQQYDISRTTTFIGSTPSDTGVSFPDGGPGHFFAVGASNLTVGNPADAAPQRSVAVTFKATDTTADFYWGLRLASAGDYNSCTQGSPQWPGASPQTNVSASPTIPNVIMIGGGGTESINPNAIVPTGTIVIRKVMVGGTGTFTFTGTPSGTISSNNGTISASVQPGTYTVTEGAPPAGWSLTSIVCTDPTSNSTGNVGTLTATINLASSETVECVFTNTKTGTLTITKVMQGGTGTFTFTGTPNGSISINNGTISATLAPGTYTSTENVPTGWTLTDITCTGQSSSTVVVGRAGGNGGGNGFNAGDDRVTVGLAAGENVNCTFTNTKDSSITITKVMQGGTDTFTFTGSPSGTISNNNGTLTQTVAPGIYTATESTPPAGWVLSSIVCDDTDSTGNLGTATATFNVAAGENVTCTFTNTKNGTITIKKVMQGGTDTFTFTGTPAGTISANNGTLSQSAAPGTYTATESAPPTGWVLTSIVCDDGASAVPSTFDVPARTVTFKVEAGENVTCTFTNTKNGTITIKKVMQGGTDTFTFTGSPSGTISTNNGTLTQSVAPGTYTATESAPPTGWVLTSIVCDDGASATPSTFDVAARTATFKVDAGENVTCTFTNTKNGMITIKKVMQGGTDTFTFTGSPSGTISTNNGTLTQSVAPGTYTATESTPPSGWILTSIVCDDTDSTSDVPTRTATFKVDAGENVICTFTNTKNGTITIKKVMQGGTDTFTFTGTPSGTISTNNGTLTQSVAPGTYTATESAPPTGWVLTNIVCDDGASAVPSTFDVPARTATFKVEAGENVTCTFTNTRQVGQIEVKKSLLPANDAGRFDFTIGSTTFNNGGSGFGDGQGTGAQTLLTGPYTISEAAHGGTTPANYNSSLACVTRVGSTPVTVTSNTGTSGSVNLATNDDIICTFTNKLKPDLTIAKTNDVDGVVALGGSFKWTLTVVNGGGDVATFQSGQTIVTDNPPATGATYGSVSVINPSGITGTISCAIASNTLTCTASGGSVTIAAAGTFGAQFTVTPTATGSLTNPRTDGVCSVDPNNNVSETNEQNNNCPPNILIVSAPDLTIGKTNDVNGTITLGGNFKWTLTVNNGGSGPATFQSGQTIITDNLPSTGVTYGSVSIVNPTGITGTISCAIASNTLACTASGGSVTIAAAGTFGAQFTVTPTATGSLTNPRTEGVCSVDPNNNVTETNEQNNNCPPNIVIVNAPDLTIGKTNDVNGTITLGGNFKWTLTVNNGGSGPATFQSGQTIVTDDLPAIGASYGAVSVVNPSGITGTVACAIASNTLTCTASGGSVTIAAAGSFGAQFTVTPSAAGSLTNPRTNGVCSVDPNNNASETNEQNNNCPPNIVIVNAPDLAISKTNDVNGAIAVGGNFKWTLTVNNGGNGPATFQSGQTIITDNLPTTGATYGAASVVNASGITGTISCAIASNTLTCTASGGTVVVAVGGTFGAQFTVTATASGSLTNPRVEGTCAVDPNNNVTESNEQNNNCGNTVTVSNLAPTIKTDIHNGVHGVVIAVTAGSTVHDSATVSGSGGTPTGSVTFSYFNNGTCTGEAAASSGAFTLNGSGFADGTTFTQTPNAIGTVSFRASYSGDSVYSSGTGPCEPLSVVPAAVDTTIATTLSGGGQTGTTILVPVNTPVTDQALLSGATANAGGTVTYAVFSNNTCSALVTSSTKTVVNGAVPASDPVSFTHTGTYYWQATYSGDANNNPSTSLCTDEQVTIYRILVKLTPTKDSFVKSEDPNTNEGANNRLRLAAINGVDFAQAPKKAKKTKPSTTIVALASGVDRPVVAFNVAGLNVTGLVKAQLVFNIATNNGGWGAGQLVEVRRITQAWTEGKGKNADLSTGTTTRGSGAGVTWNCASDTNIGNTGQNCTSAWSGGALAAPTAPAVLHTNASVGDMVWDVTADVFGGEAAITSGWIVKKVNENQTGGEALYFSKEGATAVSNLNVAPRLILYYQ